MIIQTHNFFIFFSIGLIAASCQNSSNMVTETSQQQIDSLQRIIAIQQDSLKDYAQLKDSLLKAKQIKDSLDNRSDLDKIADNKTDDSFEGVYGIYDLRAVIKPGNMSYEFYDAESTKKTPIVFFFKEKIEGDIFVYEHEEDDSYRYFRFEMQPDHKKGMYYESDEQWEVVWLEGLPSNFR